MTEQTTQNGTRREMSDHDLLIRIETLLESYVKQTSQFEQRMNNKLDDHENRLRRNERFQWIGTGIIIVIQFIVGLN